MNSRDFDIKIQIKAHVSPKKMPEDLIEQALWGRAEREVEYQILRLTPMIQENLEKIVKEFLELHKV